MGRINSWLLRRLDRLPDVQPFPPHLEKLRQIIEHRMSGAVSTAIITIGGLAILAPFIRLLPYGTLFFIVLVFPTMALVGSTMARETRKAVREYALWLQSQPPVPSRVMRMGVPYERQAPAATAECPRCLAVPGQRHARSCPSIPPEWFNRGR